MAQLAKKDEKFSSLMVPDWSLLPEELLCMVSMHLENCFDVVHARSVCRSWRSSFPFPAYLLRRSYTLPTLPGFYFSGEEFWTLERIPLFLFRHRTDIVDDAVSPCEYFLGMIGQEDELVDDDHTKLSSPLQCSVKVSPWIGQEDESEDDDDTEIEVFDHTRGCSSHLQCSRGVSDVTVMNVLGCQIFPLGHEYRMVGWNPELQTEEPWELTYRGLAFLPLNEGGEEFAVLLNYTTSLWMLRSPEMSWTPVKEKISTGKQDAAIIDVVAFRGKFYVYYGDWGIAAIDPDSLEATLSMTLMRPGLSYFEMVPCGNDELFLVERYYNEYRVRRLNGESGGWVEVGDLGNRILFIEGHGNRSCSAKELPDGCGLSGDSILSIEKKPYYRYSCYKYKKGLWRPSKAGTCGTILDSSPQVLAFRV